MKPNLDNFSHTQLWARFPQYLRVTAASGIRAAVFLLAIGTLVVSSGVTTGQAAESGSPIPPDGPTNQEIQATASAMMSDAAQPDISGTPTINLFGFERYVQGDAAVDNSLYGASGLILLLSV